MPEPSQLQEAIAAIKAGDKAKGRKLLSLFLRDNPVHENALLWMSATTDNPNEKWRYFQQVLQINPNNEKAKQALAKLESLNDEAPDLETMTGGPARPTKIRRLSTSAAPAEPVPVTVVKPKGSSNAALWITFLIVMVICCGLFYAGNTRRAAPPPAAPASDTATPAPAVPNQAAYLGEAREGVASIRAGLVKLTEAASDFNRGGGEEAANRMIIAIALIQVSHELLAETTPPGELKTFHSDLTAATGGCHGAVKSYASAIDNGDTAGIDAAIDLIVICQREMERVSSKLEGMN